MSSEDRWAAFLARCEWPAHYAHGCFVVHGRRPMLAGVTDAQAEFRLRERAPDLERAAYIAAWTGDLWIAGQAPVLPLRRAYLGPPAGLLGEATWCEHGAERELLGWRWTPACWVVCADCGKPALFRAENDWLRLWPCGDRLHSRRSAETMIDDLWRATRRQRKEYHP